MSSSKDKHLQKDLTMSRLSSISEQSNEVEGSVKTSEALLNIYYQLYAINYMQIPIEPKRFFHKLSERIQQQKPNQNIEKFKEQINKKKGENFLKYIKQKQKDSIKLSTSPNRILTNEELQQRIRLKMQQTPNNKKEKHQFMSTANSKQIYAPNETTEIIQLKQQRFYKQLDQTAQQKILVSQILSQLNILDEQRTQIKYQIFTQQNSKIDGLYLKWTNLHQKMKEALEVYINKIWNGKTLQQLYNDFDNIINSRKVVEGFLEKQLLFKLDVYLQSLFLDERQILLYRNSSEKPRNLRIFPNTNNTIRKKIVYN